MARPSHKPTDETRAKVTALASFGITEDDISRHIGVAPHTLRKHYRDELDNAVANANAMVAQSLYNMATKGEGKTRVTAAIFWLKTRAGWRETTVHEHNGKAGGPIQILITPDDAAL